MKTTKKRIKFILCIVLSVMALIFVCLWIGGQWFIHKYVSDPKFKSKLESSASEFLKRPLTIESLHFKPGLLPVLEGKNVILWKTDKKNQYSISSERVEIEFSLISIFSFPVGLTNMTFIHPEIVIRRNNNSEWDIVKYVQSFSNDSSPAASKIPFLIFQGFEIEEGMIKTWDNKNQQPIFPPIITSAKGRLDRKSGHFVFPYKGQGKINSTNTNLAFEGLIGKSPFTKINLEHAPTNLFSFFIPQASSSTGVIDFTCQVHTETKEMNASLFITSFSVSAISLSPTDVEFSYQRKKSQPARWQGKLKSHQSDIEFNGISRDNKTEIQAQSSNLNGEEALIYAAVGKSGYEWVKEKFNPSTAATSSTLSFDYQASKINYKQIEPTDVFIKGNYENKFLTIAEMKAGLFSGEWSSTLRADLSGSEPTGSFNWTIGKMDLGSILSSFESSVGGLGTISSTGNLNMKFSKNGWKQSQGDFSLHLSDGYFDKLPVLVVMLSQLNLKSVLTSSNKNAPDRFPFEATIGQFKIDNGVIRTKEPFLIKNKTLRIAYIGNLNMINKSWDGKMLVQALTVASELIQQIPGVRDLLLGENKSLVPIVTRIKGPLGNPKIEVQSTKTITGPIWNSLERTFKLPKKILDSIRGE